MKIKDITNHLEKIAPLSYQETYDNSGLIVGNKDSNVLKVLLCLDSIEEVVEEAIKINAQLIIAHHPIVFSGLKKFTGSNYIERTIIKAIKNDIAIYACHTNLDNVLNNGINQKIASKIGLKNTRILAPKKGILKKIITYIPKNNHETVLNELFKAGAGKIGNYSECSFNNLGTGTFKAEENSNPTIGEKHIRHKEEEIKTEVLVETRLLNKVISALISSHPYEEVAYDIISIENKLSNVGSGIIGELNNEMDFKDFLMMLKSNMNLTSIKYTNQIKETINKVAICGGSGSFLLHDAIKNKADIFITSDYKYHQFFDAENQITIADIGHYESEQYTIDLFNEILSKEFKNLKIVKTSINTNPINYL